MPGVDASEDALEGLLDALSAQAVSEPIQIEDNIIIPVHKIILGFSTRMKRTGENNKETNDAENGEEGALRNAADGAAGCGAGISPVAVLIISNGSSGPDGVKAVPLSPTGESLFDIAGNLKENIEKRKKKGEKETGDMAAIIIE
jgi:uncharacterized spore protein YtfJ